MQPTSPHPALTAPVQSRTYQIQTHTTTLVREKTAGNSITLTLRLTYYGPANNGTDTVLVELLDFQQTDQSPLSVLMAALNPVNNRLVFEVSTYGDLLNIRNLDQVEEQWRALRPGIVYQYGRTPDGMAFINGFGQQLHSDALMTNLRHKGAYGVLFPGLFGRNGAVRTGVSSRLLKGFFGAVDLPLLLQTEAQPDPQLPGGRQLLVTGSLDTDRFDEAGLRRLVREAVDMLNFRVSHRINCREDYHLDASGWLTAARQELTFTIENFYYQHTQHELKRIGDGQ